MNGKMVSSGILQRIAVLPFVNEGADEMDYLTDGLTDLCRNTLIHSPHYFSITKESVDLLQQWPGLELAGIYEKLSVELILSAALSGGTGLKFKIQLHQRETTRPLWEKSIDLSQQEIFQLGHLVLQALGEVLNISDRRTGPSMPSSRRAYRAFLLGGHYLNRWERAYVELALQQFRLVFELEPDFVPACLGIAKATIFLVGRGYQPARQEYPAVVKLLEDMIRFRPDYGELYIYRGIIQFFYELDWAAAYENIERGLESFSEASEAYATLSFFWYGMREYDRAIDALQIALEYNPLSVALINMLGDIQLSARRFDAAKKTFNQILDLQAGDKVAIENLMYMAALDGNTRQVRHYLKELTKGAKASVLDFPRLAYVYPYLMMKKEVAALEQELFPPSGHLDPVYYGRRAGYFASQKKWEQVMRAIEQVFDARYGLLYVLTDPQFEPVRSWKRYRQLEQQIKLPQLDQSGHELQLQSDLKESLLVDPNRILYLQADEKYVRIVMQSYFRVQTKILRISLSRLLKQLPSADFYRCHRSYAINRALPLVWQGNAHGLWLHSQKFGFRVPVSRTKIMEVKRMFGQH
ncbi:MAG: LytTR family transcriptional regulator DNA-binding domain-containing protein [Bacteroidota bacterium]